MGRSFLQKRAQAVRHSCSLEDCFTVISICWVSHATAVTGSALALCLRPTQTLVEEISCVNSEPRTKDIKGIWPTFSWEGSREVILTKSAKSPAYLKQRDVSIPWAARNKLMTEFELKCFRVVYVILVSTLYRRDIIDLVSFILFPIARDDNLVL